MNLKLFKINIKEIFIITILSLPISVFLYFYNSSRISYDVKAKRGFAIAENFCENYNPNRVPLLKGGDIALINQKYRDRESYLKEKNNIKTNIILREDTETYDIIFKGVDKQENIMKNLSKEILKDIYNLELNVFDNSYASVRLHCKTGEYAVFKLQSMKTIDVEYPSTNLYKKSKLYLLFFLPFFLIYAIILSIRYIILIKK